MTCAHGGQLNWVARKKSAAKVDLRTVEDAMENEAVVVAVARVRAKVFDGLRALVPEEPEADVAHGRPERRLRAEQRRLHEARARARRELGRADALAARLGREAVQELGTDVAAQREGRAVVERVRERDR